MKLHSNVSMNQLKKRDNNFSVTDLKLIALKKKKKDGAPCTNDGKGVKGTQETTTETEKSALSVLF